MQRGVKIIEAFSKYTNRDEKHNKHFVNVFEKSKYDLSWQIADAFFSG